MAIDGNSYLHRKLSQKRGLKIEVDFDPLVVVSYRSKEYRIATADHKEYIVTTAFVDEVHAIGGNMIVHPKDMLVSGEAISYAENMGIKIMKYAEVYELFHVNS